MRSTRAWATKYRTFFLERKSPTKRTYFEKMSHAHVATHFFDYKMAHVADFFLFLLLAYVLIISLDREEIDSYNKHNNFAK